MTTHTRTRLLRVLLAVLAVDFLALCTWVIHEHGYAGFYAAALRNSATVLLSLDLVVALALVSVWMVLDARRRGASVVPYLLLTLFLGSPGPLLYLWRRLGQADGASQTAPGAGDLPAGAARARA